MSVKYIPTANKVEVQDYPYGFKLRTTLYDSIEVRKSHGYRHVTQTINPKNGKLNKPKASTYYDFMIRYFDENNHIKSKVISFNTDPEKLNASIAEINSHWDILDDNDKEYLYSKMVSVLKVNHVCAVNYRGMSMEESIAKYGSQVKLLIKTLSSKMKEEIETLPQLQIEF